MAFKLPEEGSSNFINCLFQTIWQLLAYSPKMQLYAFIKN
jgi:hypothetical protein